MAPFRTIGRILAACLVFGTMQAQEKSAATPVEVDQNTAKFIEAAKAKAQSDAPKDASTVQSVSANVADASEAGKDAADAQAPDQSKDNPKGKKKPKKKKEKKPKMTPVSIVNGTLTVDGATGKALMNYDIADLKFIYIYAPGIGTAVVSNKAFPGAVEQKSAFSKNALDVMIDDHKLEVYSDKPMFDVSAKDVKKDKDLVKQLERQPVSAWVTIDKEFALSTNYPAMGFGTATAAPYAWPGSKPVPKREKGVVTPPPMPVALRPVLLKQSGAPGPAGSTAATANAASGSSQKNSPQQPVGATQ